MSHSPPSPGGGGQITANHLTYSSVQLNFSVATDPNSLRGEWVYSIYQSRLTNIATVEQMRKNGTALVGSPSSTGNVLFYEVTGLDSNVPYFFNVMVTDVDGFSSAYVPVAVRTTAMYLFAYGQTVQGNLDGRSGADSLCKKSLHLPGSCQNVHAFLSVSSSDQISSFPSQYSFSPTSIPILSVPIPKNQQPGGVILANNWNQFLSIAKKEEACITGSPYCKDSDSLKSVLGAAYSFAPRNLFWTGEGETKNESSTCMNWTSNDGNVSGVMGTSPFPASMSYSFLSGTGGGCNNSIDLLCLCW